MYRNCLKPRPFIIPFFLFFNSDLWSEFFVSLFDKIVEKIHLRNSCCVSTHTMKLKAFRRRRKRPRFRTIGFEIFFSTPSFFLFDRQRVVCDTEKPMGEGNDRIWAVVTGLRVHRNNLGPICISIGHPIISPSRKKKKNRKKGEKKKNKNSATSFLWTISIIGSRCFSMASRYSFQRLDFFFFYAIRGKFVSIRTTVKK